jgi:signal peptidase II
MRGARLVWVRFLGLRLLGLFVGAGLLVGLDHGSKLVMKSMKAALPLTLTPFLNLVDVTNKGVSFGLFPAGSPGQVWFLCACALLIVGVVIHWYTRASGVVLQLGLLSIVGGALGNVLDRILWGGGG